MKSVNAPGLRTEESMTGGIPVYSLVGPWAFSTENGRVGGTTSEEVIGWASASGDGTTVL